MATPDFILSLREKIGTDMLWLSGVTAVVLREEHVLLVRRTDNGAWTPVTGIIDPGEQPADAAAREVLEETGVQARAELLASVSVTHPNTYSNGDRTQYLDLTFRFRWEEGEPYPADGENSEAAWFPLGNLPEMSREMLARINSALADCVPAAFQFRGLGRQPKSGRHVDHARG